MKITKSELKKIIAEEAAKLATEAPNIPDVMGAMGGGKFQPRHEVIEVVDGEMGDILFFSDRPVQLSSDGPSRKPDSDIGDWNALVKDLKLRPEDVTDTLMVKKPGHSMYELSHDEFSALELALEKETNPSLKNVTYTPDMQREGKEMKITENQLRRIIRESILLEYERYVYRDDDGQLRIQDDDGNDEAADHMEDEYGYLRKGEGETILGTGRGRSPSAPMQWDLGRSKRRY